jgi:hypothetical protein
MLRGGKRGMFASFKYGSIPLKDIALDERNPRIVTPARLKSQAEILQYLYEHEGLEDFVKKIASEGKNIGAERPYVVKNNNEYVVVEGNNRIAAYKLLTGLLTPPSEYGPPPHVSSDTKTALLSVDCSIAPTRDALLPIMASAHFGLGDKSKWGYLGSRKAVYDEWKSGKSIPKLAKAFDRTLGQIKELILEYLLYREALALSWTSQEKAVLLSPSVEFNPPVRFLQTSGHKQKMGISYDTTNIKVVFESAQSKQKLHHLLKKLVIAPQKGLGATASYDEVFADYVGKGSSAKASAAASSGGSKTTGAAGTTSGSGSSTGKAAASPKLGALFAYPVTVTNAVISQLMKEAKAINGNNYPAATTFLLRNIVECLLKHIIDDQKANPASKTLDLESAISLCLTQSVVLPQIDKKVLTEFRKQYLNYLNLGAHGNVVPNPAMVFGARDLIDQFIKKNI